MHNLKLIVAYDGTAYFGWQKTEARPSVEAALQVVLERILQHPVSLQAASRTDAGVHAQAQVVNFSTPKEGLDFGKLRAGLNGLLPPDISVLSVEAMPTSFHPTLDCRGKEYRYFLCLDRVQFPHHRLYSWHIPHPLNIESMRRAVPFLTGQRDFSAFCNARKGTPYADRVREVQWIELIPLEGRRLCFRISGNHFLYKMVRNLVGTLVAIGRGKIHPEEIPAIMQAGLRCAVGVTAPAHGLFLHEVFY